MNRAALQLRFGPTAEPIRWADNIPHLGRIALNMVAAKTTIKINDVSP